MKSTVHNSNVKKERLRVLTEKGEKYSRKVASVVTKKDYTKPESALAVVGDTEYHQRLIEICERFGKTVRHVVVIGIGGSSLGVEALYHALALQTHATLHVLDSIEGEAVEQLKETIRTIGHIDELAICIVSKSGNTTETVTNAVLFIEACEELLGVAVRERVVCVGSEGSAFLKNMEKENVLIATIPEHIGGRFSIFTAAGMVPALLIGLDVIDIRAGAAAIMEKKQRSDIVAHAAHLVALAEGGIDTVTFFLFNDRLEMMGYWYRQLLAESIGKQMKTNGTTFSHQLLPTVATSVDLHSMAQLYLGGFKGMYTHFVYGDVESDHHRFSDHWMMRHLEMLHDHTPKEIKNAIRDGVLKAYNDQKLPYRLTELPKITGYELGFLMASLMFEVMVLGELFGVDPFNQPNVESYKKYTRKILTS